MVKALVLAMAASGAESDGSDDSERYGSGRGSRDPDRVSTKDLPKWTGKRGDYPEWHTLSGTHPQKGRRSQLWPKLLK